MREETAAITARGKARSFQVAAFPPPGALLVDFEEGRTPRDAWRLGSSERSTTAATMTANAKRERESLGA
jgi:hypothetical protein